MFKFVTPDATGSAPKRQQTQKACEPCRRRKKRCIHSVAAPKSSQSFAEASQNVGDSPQQHSSSSAAPIETRGPEDFRQPSPRSSEKRAEDTEGANSTRDGLLTDGSSIVPQQSAANPENRTDGASDQVGREDTPNSQPSESLGSRFIGDLSPEGMLLAATSSGTTRGASMSDSIGVWLSSSLNRKASQPVPLTHSEQFPSNLFYGSTSLVQKVLVPVLEQECLSTMPPPVRFTALSRVYFEKIHPIFPVIDQQLLDSLPQTDPGRVLLQQCICLAASKNFVVAQHLILTDNEPPLSCQEFADRMSGAMRLSMELGLVSNKIILISALALMSQFIDSPDNGDLASQLCARAIHHAQSIGLHIKGQQREDRDQNRTTLFCCIWVIDRMNAAFNGRPVLMHERDISHNLEHCFEQQASCFRLFIRVVVVLDKVIGLYRPSIVGASALHESYPSFEDLVISCNASSIGTSLLATIETLYHAITILSCRSRTWADLERSSFSYLRQSLSTTTLSSTIARELHDQLVLFPFIPYALSLALSVAYREMRHTKVPLHRARAQIQFQTICDALTELETVFRSASTTAEMGRKLLKEMDRVVSTVAVSGSKPNLEGPVSSGARTDASQPKSLSAAPNFSDESGTHIETLTPAQSAVQDFDPSIFDVMADVDLFGMFDPAFNLDGFDACLENNLNPSFTAYMQ